MNNPDQAPATVGQGAEVSLELLCARYRPVLVRYFIRRGQTLDVAEDCVQDVFLRITRADFGPVNNVEAYLFTMASNVLADHGRKLRARRSHQHEPIENFDLEGGDASPSRVLEGKEAILRLDMVLNELDPRTRELFLLNRLDGLSYTQLAARFGMSVAAVEKRMSKALVHLRKRLPDGD